LVDLHTHSTASDGLLTPTELARAAHATGLSTIALTDHETTDGVDEAQLVARTLGVEVIAGVEINSADELGAVHFLGYFVDGSDAALQEVLRKIRDARANRAREMLARLETLGMPLDWERVQTLAGKGASIARPHIARALIEQGYVVSVSEAFEKHIGNGKPAYVDRFRLAPREAIARIHAAGGLIVLAHPAVSGTLDRIEALQELGLDGIEVYYAEHRPQDIVRLKAIAAERDLLMTGGSDFHGWNDGVHANLGEVYVPPECADRLRARARPN
jgi:predicted metal-dependent phosphoesterase TrpH